MQPQACIYRRGITEPAAQLAFSSIKHKNHKNEILVRSKWNSSKAPKQKCCTTGIAVSLFFREASQATPESRRKTTSMDSRHVWFSYGGNGRHRRHRRQKKWIQHQNRGSNSTNAFSSASIHGRPSLCFLCPRLLIAVWLQLSSAASPLSPPPSRFLRPAPPLSTAGYDIEAAKS